MCHLPLNVLAIGAFEVYRQAWGAAQTTDSLNHAGADTPPLLRVLKISVPFFCLQVTTTNLEKADLVFKMGEAKRRKQILGENYGLPEFSPTVKRRRQKFDKMLEAEGKTLLPDWGSVYLKTFGEIPMTLYIEHPSVYYGDHPQGEAHIGFRAEGCLGTIITTNAKARKFMANHQQLLRIIPDPSDTYYSQIGEKVVPFKLLAMGKEIDSES